MLITGTRKGIGRYLVDYYVAKGYRVVGVSRGCFSASINGYSHFEADISDESAMLEVFSSIRKQFGRLDVLLNNAGIGSMNHILLTPTSTIRSILETNVVGALICCREAAKLMKKGNFGRIVNFSSVATPLKLEGETIYAASKAAVDSFTQILARELGSYGITVNAVGPNPIKTDLVNTVPKAKIDELLSRQAIKRFGEFEDVSNVIDFFLRKESNFITGQIIFLGGI